MLKLICGPSGSGKTKAITDLIRADIEAGKRCFLLVPEQQAYISERDLPAQLPKNAGLYFEIVNFSGLAEDVFREYGGVTQKSAGKGERLLLMWDTLRTVAPLLRQYGKGAASDTALPAMMLRAVEDFRANGITGEALEMASGQLPPELSLSKKLSDLSLIDAVYRQRCEAAFGNDPGDRLLRASALLRKNNYFAGCHLYVDSFTSFTSPEYEMLGEILRQADALTVTLCTDDFASTLPHFEGTVRTAKRLGKLAARLGCQTEKQVLTPKSDNRSDALSAIARDLWRFDLRPDERQAIPAGDDSVRLISAANLYEESEAVALNVLELVQNGMHYGDIAIVARDSETYRGVLDAAFERYNIPYFISERTDLSTKPLARLLLSSLRAVSHYYRLQDVITLVKTGLLDVSLADAAMFEDYCETWHLSGGRFTDDVWNMNPDGLTVDRSARAEIILDAANRVRRTVIEPLERLRANLQVSPKLVDRCRAVYHYLCDLQISERLAARAKAELARGARREAGETLRLYRSVTDTLSSLCTLLPDAEVTTDELILVLTLLFSETDLGSVPSLHDCVIVGSASTLRVENVKASFLLGLCEGEFPAALTDDGILSEGEKLRLEEFDIIFDTNSRLRSAEELFYVYRAMTKPSEKLFLSTVEKQTDGSARTPSLAFSRAKFLLKASNDAIEKFDTASIDRALNIPNFQSMEASLRLPPREDGVTLRLSQSKIRAFALCPYSYYSTYGLHLREQKDGKPSYADDGTFLHSLFESFLRRAIDENGVFNLPAEEEIEPLAEKITDEYVASVCPLPPDKTDKRLLHLFARLYKLAVVMLRDILDELRCSRFIPEEFERVIGGIGKNGLPPVVIPLKNGSRVILSGKIDRVDFCDAENGKRYVRIIDYKSSQHNFSTDDVRSGVDIQPMLYLLAMLASNPDRLLPGGAQYLFHQKEKGRHVIRRSGFYAETDELRAMADTSEDGRYSKKLDWHTLDEIEELTREMKCAVASVAERILAGEAQKTPSEEACRFCAVRKSCDKACRS